MPVLTKINTNSIAEDAITGDKFAGDAYLANSTTQNISGTYSENRLYTSDAYTLSGNATVNSHLTLSSVKPTADVVLTAGGAYTLTGTGVLSAGSLFSPKSNDLTGMTGVLGSVVTGSPALNLSNTIGADKHIIQTKEFIDGEARVGTGAVTAITGVMTMEKATNKILAIPSIIYSMYESSSGECYCGFQYESSGTGVTAETKKWGTYNSSGNYSIGFYQGGGAQEKVFKGTYCAIWVFTPQTTNPVTISIIGKPYAGSLTVNQQGGSTPYDSTSSLILQELQV